MSESEEVKNGGPVDHTFTGLINAEYRVLDREVAKPQKVQPQPADVRPELSDAKKATGKATNYVVSTAGRAGEPWLAFTSEDRVGLALSGGGIRSATFNLGVLQALRDKGVLRQVDYFSTVSGGGYIGGFWTRWWHAISENLPKGVVYRKRFPHPSRVAAPAPASGPAETREPAAIRHLREFSRFLIPRQGLNMEFWSAAITVLSGTATSLVAAAALALFVMALWALLATWMVRADSHIYCEIFAALMFVVLGGDFVLLLASKSEVEQGIRKTFNGVYLMWTVIALMLALISLWSIECMFASEWTVVWKNLLPEGGAILFVPCAALAVSLAALTVTRLWCERFRSGRNVAERGENIARAAAADRVMGRLLAIQVAWLVMAGIWALALWLKGEAGAKGFITTEGGAGALTAVLTMLFVWTRKWMTDNKESRYKKYWDKLRPWVPKLSANAIVVLLLVLAAVFVRGWNLESSMCPVYWILGVCAGVLLAVAWLFDPARVGMHEFYRARLTRCYLGGGNINESNGQVSIECPGDDMKLADDKDKPIHLICCAANQLWGDPLGTLHRGARSAVLSRHGIAIGDSWKEDKDLWLSSAMTASAAAFNSLMGERNMELGRAVAFVMTALNLRLGLWVKNPANCKRHDWPAATARWLQEKCPGLLFFKEMLGIAQCRTDERAAAYMHLSDGGHFENLALYELIRRHCRYIIVSDAGQDPEFDFTDFGRATRRVREDFGVEIEINLAPLKPDADGISKQHLAVGTIHYDGLEGTDKGTIVYFKPSMVGDEPPDVLQYRRRAPAFPHETTGDQFFDEAQWESYRRLGEHVCHAGLRMIKATLSRLGPSESFRALRLNWYRVPWMQGDSGIRLCEHANALESALLGHGNPALRQEFFGGVLGAGAGGTAPAVQRDDSDVLLIIRALKFIEEAWVVCVLDDYWSHPLANNWMARLNRWAAMPTLRYWWPLLAPLFGADFQRFAIRILKLPALDPVGVAANIRLNPVVVNLTPETSFAWRRFHECQPDSGKTPRFTLDLTLPSIGAAATFTIQIGLAFVQCTGSVAEWDINDLFIPPELYGGGFTTKLLDLLIEHFRQQKNAVANPVTRLEVTVKTKVGRSQGERQKQIELIDFYRSRGFEFDNVRSDRMVLWLK